jgi:hypothetical protein
MQVHLAKSLLKLFGLYSKESKRIQWMTYQEFDRDKCRAVLNIGTSWEYTVRNYISS